MYPYTYELGFIVVLKIKIPDFFFTPVGCLYEETKNLHDATWVGFRNTAYDFIFYFHSSL